MTPGEVRQELERLLEATRDLERDLDRNIAANVGWIPISHEIVEASDSLDRALVLLDDTYHRLN